MNSILRHDHERHESSQSPSIGWKRMEERIRKEIAILIFDQQKKDENLGFLSVTKVQLAKDYAVLKVWVSLFSTESSLDEQTWQALIAHCKFLQSRLSRNLHLRATPQMRFVRDTSILQGDEVIEKIMDQPRPRDGSGPPKSESKPST